MKKKDMIIGAIIVVVILIAVVVTLICVRNNNKSKDKKGTETNNTSTTKYEIKDQEYEDLTIENIEVEAYTDYSIVTFTITNHTDNAYESGNMTFLIESNNTPLEVVVAPVSTIAAKDSVDVDIILNTAYKDIDNIKIVK